MKWDVDYFSSYFKSKDKICQLSLEAVQWGIVTFICHGRKSVFLLNGTCFKKEADPVQQKRLFYLFIVKRLHFMQVIIIGNIWSNLCKLTLRNCKKKMKLF